mmetsp:Transcript_61739/g.169875  ORF Transcript_61739/g.169875 Transcript_61739/m.169875 type:complete len:111 (-) Transcript_61739:353-685(-)
MELWPSMHDTDQATQISWPAHVRMCAQSHVDGKFCYTAKPTQNIAMLSVVNGYVVSAHQTSSSDAADNTDATALASLAASAAKDVARVFEQLGSDAHSMALKVRYHRWFR